MEIEGKIEYAIFLRNGRLAKNALCKHTAVELKKHFENILPLSKKSTLEIYF